MSPLTHNKNQDSGISAGAGSVHTTSATANNTSTFDHASSSRPISAYGQQERPLSSSSTNDGLQRSASRTSLNATATSTLSRGNTLKKRNSLVRKSSLKRSNSRKSLGAGSIKDNIVGANDLREDSNSVFYTPIPLPTSNTLPTDILANRFQGWRNYLKSLITYFKEVQASYEVRAKTITKLANTLSGIPIPPILMTTGGLTDANRLLHEHHQNAHSEALKAKEIEIEIIEALNGLRSDLGAKVKEIKGLKNDFKNTVAERKEVTKKAIATLSEAIQHYEQADGMDKGFHDPFLARMNVDRMVELQIDEENYLHRAYLNIENSGRELEAVVVGEVQKAFNAFANILQREGDEVHNTVDLLRSGPIAMAKDVEWQHFVGNEPHLINSDLPLRKIHEITFPGQHHPAAAEIRCGMLERKSKYLKTYTVGWYVLSPTHIHEYKSSDSYTQPPIMSLYLADQKLGAHSTPDAKSHKFILKGKQSGGLHKSHSWTFRAESDATMHAWLDDIIMLTQKSGAEKSNFVRQHARSFSSASGRPSSSYSSDGIAEDEADHVPFANEIQIEEVPEPVIVPQSLRPQPGGRFPSELTISRTDQQSDHLSEAEQPTNAENLVVLPVLNRQITDTNPYHLRGVATHESLRNDGEIIGQDQVGSTPPVAPHTFVLPIRSQPSPIAEQTSAIEPRVDQNEFNQAVRTPGLWAMPVLGPSEHLATDATPQTNQEAVIYPEALTNAKPINAGGSAELAGSSHIIGGMLQDKNLTNLVSTSNTAGLTEVNQGALEHVSHTSNKEGYRMPGGFGH